MAKVRWPLIVVMAAVGAVWVGQGIGLISGSFMTGEPLWAIIGAAMVGASLVLTASARRAKLNRAANHSAGRIDSPEEGRDFLSTEMLPEVSR